MSKLIMMVRHAVEDYRKWRPVFDGDMGKQKAAGLTVAGIDWPNKLAKLKQHKTAAKGKPKVDLS